MLAGGILHRQGEFVPDGPQDRSGQQAGAARRAGAVATTADRPRVARVGDRLGSAASLKVGRNRVSAAPAATLLKGDHVQIQGQLRTREFDKPGDKNGTGKQPVTEIHVTSIFKLDRSAKQNADQPAVGKWPNPDISHTFCGERETQTRLGFPKGYEQPSVLEWD